MANKADSLIVKLNVHRHHVTVANELLVKIKHNKDCQKPCPDSEKIVSYLEDELFVAEGFVVTDIHK